MRGRLFITCVTLLLCIELSSCSLSSKYKKANKEAAAKNASLVRESAQFTLNPVPSNWSKEVLMGLFANGNELSVRVKTGGCTKKSDFWLWCHYNGKSNAGPPHYILTIYRTKQDRCKAFHPSGTLIKFNLREELGLPNYFTYSVTNQIETGVALGK